jgi:hypothetical protein
MVIDAIPDLLRHLLFSLAALVFLAIRESFNPFYTLLFFCFPRTHQHRRPARRDFQAMATQPSSFRFLDLPKELRLMVYERSPTTTRHYDIEDPKENGDSTIRFVAKLVELNIMSTCRLVYDECIRILGRRLEALRTEPRRFIVDSTSLYSMTRYSDFNLLDYIELYSEALIGQTTEFWVWEDGIDWPGCYLPPDSLAHARALAFIDKVVKLSVSRSPSSTIIAVRPRSFSTRLRGVHRMQYLVSEVACAAEAAAHESLLLQRKLELLSPKVYPHGFDMKEALRAEFELTNETWKEGKQTLIDDMSPEEWSLVWEEGEVYE